MRSMYDLLLSDRLSYGHAASLMSQMINTQRAVTQTYLSDEVLRADVEVSQVAFAQYRYMTDFEKTALLIDELVRCIRAKESSGQLDPSRSRYATHVLLDETTRLRQLIDRHGLPYRFYIVQALQYWVAKKRSHTPRAADLIDGDVVSHVLAAWADPSKRSSYPLIATSWDPRFDPDRFTGDGPQVALIDLVVQRVEDVRAAGGDPVNALSLLLDRSISEHEATRRFGSEFVHEAIAQKANEDGLDAFLSDLKR